MKKRIIIAVCVMTMVATIQAVAGIIAGPITNAANSHVYYLLTPNFWTASEAEAESLGGTLAIINNSAEQSWVFSTFGSYGGVPNRNLWIGLRRDWTGGPFEWVTGAPLTYTNWSPGEPDNCGGDESFVHMWSSSNKFPGQWNDAADGLNLDGSSPNGVVEVPQGKSLTNGEKSLIGTWYEGGRIDRPCYIAGTENMLFAIRSYGLSARIIYVSNHHIFAASWHTRGEILQDKILWSDGSWWSKTALNYSVPTMPWSSSEILPGQIDR